MITRSRHTAVSSSRVSAAARAASAVNESEERLSQLERDLAAHEKEVARVDAERRKMRIIVDMPVYPSLGEARARATRGVELRTALRVETDRLSQLRQRAQEAEAAARPLSQAAVERLRDLVARCAADDELAALGIPVAVLNQTAGGRAHLTDLAREYGLVEGP